MTINLNMDSDQVFDLIETVSKLPGKLDKEKTLAACKTSNSLQNILKAAYDPTISYGIKAVPSRAQTSDAGETFGDLTWQLINNMRRRDLTGGAMLAAVESEINRLSAKSADLLKRVLLKDLRAGFGESTTNKVFKNLLPEFPYMRCCLPKDAKLDAFDWVTGVISQEKADGMFANVDHEADGTIAIRSRQGSIFPMEKFTDLSHWVEKLLTPDTQSHGEILVLRDDVVLAREIGNGILNSVLKGGDFEDNERPVFMVWDQIPLNAVQAKGSYAVAYRTRLTSLIRQLQQSHDTTLRIIPTRIVHSLADAYKHYAELLAAGMEGTVIKDSKATWRDGTSKQQVKLKLDFVVDLKVIGFEAGNGKNEATFGSMITESSDGALRVSVSGISDKLRAEIHANKDTWLGSIISVRANGIMKPSQESGLHSLFLPRFVEQRLDKREADSLLQVFDQEEAAKTGAALLKEAA